MTAAFIDPPASDPIWAAALAAPPCEEPIPPEVLRGLEDDIAAILSGRSPSTPPPQNPCTPGSPSPSAHPGPQNHANFSTRDR